MLITTFMKRFFLVVLVGLVLCACSAKKQVAQHHIDRTERERVVSYRDTVFTVPGSTAELELAIAELRKDREAPKTYESRDGNATARLIIKRDTVRVEAICDSVELRAKIKQELIRESIFKQDTRTEETHTGVSGFEHWVSVIVAFVIGAVVGAILSKFII